MGRLEKYQALAGRQLRKNADVLYRHSDTWTGTGQRLGMEVTCRFSVDDPNETSQGVQRAQSLTGDLNVLDVRLLDVHPDDPKPELGDTVPWDGGTLKLVNWSTVNDFTLQAEGVCRLT